MKYIDVILGTPNNFELNIGRRVTKNELRNSPTGSIPIISACLNEPFGHINSNKYVSGKRNIVLWNIDSSRWDTRIIKSYVPFIPTDHCGYMIIKNNEILPEYVSYKLYEQGLRAGFCHQYRASLKNIGEVTISLPVNDNGQFDINEQKRISTLYELYKGTIDDLAERLKFIQSKSITIASKSKFESVSIGTILDYKKGKSKYTEQYCLKHVGTYPVYSADTKGQLIIGSVDTCDFKDEGLRITTNGHYAGSVRYIPKSEYSVNGDAAILTLKVKYFGVINYKYLEFALQDARERYGFSWSNKPKKGDIDAIEIQLPIKGGIYDIPEQERISSRYYLHKGIIADLQEQLSSIWKSFIKIV